MATLYPQIAGALARRGPVDLYGEPTYQGSIPVAVGVVKLSVGKARSSVRADQSASRGRMDEAVAAAVLLFQPKVTVSPGDRLTLAAAPFAGLTLEIVSIEGRYDLRGRLAHTEAVLEYCSVED